MAFLNLALTNAGMAKWYIICLLVIFRYRLVQVTTCTSAVVGTKIKNENEDGITDGCEIENDDVKVNFVDDNAMNTAFDKAKALAKKMFDAKALGVCVCVRACVR
eukprot:5809184-Amphidinium_carterae.1